MEVEVQKVSGWAREKTKQKRLISILSRPIHVVTNGSISSFLFFELKNMFINFTETGRERERKRKNISWLPPIYALMGDRTCNPGMCPDQELNTQPFGVWDDAPTNQALPARAVPSLLVSEKYISNEIPRDEDVSPLLSPVIHRRTLSLSPCLGHHVCTR